MTSYGWPREKTKLCLSKEKIDLVSRSKLCLVSKHNYFWYISFSRAAKTLLRCIDTSNTCRRKCHKILKSDFLNWQSEAPYEGISTFIFKVYKLEMNLKVVDVARKGA